LLLELHFNNKLNKFIKKAIVVHKNKYDYSYVDYVNSTTKIKIICKKHGEFYQRPKDHINQKQGCPKCAGKNLSHCEILEKINHIHDYKYKYINFAPKNVNDYIDIECEKHGIFRQTLLNHMYCKSNCPKCVGNDSHTLEKFIKKAIVIHGDLYDYSDGIYVNNFTKIKIICKKHGEFYQRPKDHLNHQTGCPNCRQSKGEKEIFKILSNMNIDFETQKTFKNCTNLYKLRFDFYIPSMNLCIEYQGIQHYKCVPFFGGESSYQKTKENDVIKKQFCSKNGIEILYIKYTQYKNIKIIIEKKLNIKE
jgi:very-short-patch-repair endonuclease